VQAKSCDCVLSALLTQTPGAPREACVAGVNVERAARERWWVADIGLESQSSASSIAMAGAATHCLCFFKYSTHGSL
jgi:hypothetical protein